MVSNIDAIVSCIDAMSVMCAYPKVFSGFISYVMTSNVILCTTLLCFTHNTRHLSMSDIYRDTAFLGETTNMYYVYRGND